MKVIINLCFALISFVYLIKANANTLITYADAITSPAVYLDLGEKGDSLGDQWLFDQPLLDINGDKIGNNSGVCLRTKIGSSSQCQWTLTLAKGTIQVAGREFDQGSSSISIVGGTGLYKHISGELISVKQKNGTFKQTLFYTINQGSKKKNKLKKISSLINDVRANSHYACSECHGKTGNPPITDKYAKQSPILAGQSMSYLTAQLLHFKSGARHTQEMDKALTDYNLDEIKMIAAYFSKQVPLNNNELNPSIDTLKHNKLQDAQWAKKGKQLYFYGDESRNINACSSCHGDNAQGNIALNAPRLKNQHARYIRMTLSAYSQGTRTTDKHLSFVMKDISKKLNQDDIKHVAAYIQSM
ncbi:c-type cytochrome [Pseudoalteromonas denitrificans]|uniref:Cytochrome c553 n=1 Tax=Pseudoalteromonas denitrificans DSM 6059 TaxID=1123010 RepID=A0A1I1TV15_9GAMM|nr:c-type cytochrome [Pseudoalteromonas denitrificans]SFD59400.1 Cytochrome c553 [Pseudoalteromonas denitrificans DSM 6059]